MARFVLVHGAFDGGFAFQRLSALLRRGGHQVFTPTLTGSGDKFHLLSRDVHLETHIQDVASFLFHEDLRDVVLVVRADEAHHRDVNHSFANDLAGLPQGPIAASPEHVELIPNLKAAG